MIKIKDGGDPIPRPRVTEKLLRTVTEIRAASRKSGRPSKPDALSPAQRAKAYRERKAKNG